MKRLCFDYSTVELGDTMRTALLGFITNTRDTSLRNQYPKGILTQKGWEPSIQFCLVFPHVFTS